MINIREIKYGSPEYLVSVKLRDKILRKPLGLVFTDEFLQQDKSQFHIAAFDNNENLIAILILKIIDENTLKMRQVAVDNHLQGQGIGTQLVTFAEKFALEKGFNKIILHARKSAVKFYQSLNYSITSNEFEEVGLPHYRMEKFLGD